MTGDEEAEVGDLGRLFFEVHKDLPREGPGSAASTRRALKVLEPFLPQGPKIVDVGCGPGAQTVDLAGALPGAKLTAIDLHEPFLTQAREQISAREVADRVVVVCADMGEWTPSEPLDVVWCEGAAYFIGLENSLRRWASWLKPAGFIAFTEAVLLTDSPSPRTVALWQGYPALNGPTACLALTTECGYEVLDSFVLPQSDWLDEYYAPMQQRIDDLRAEYAADAEAIAELEVHQEEIDVCRQHGDEYGYLFVIARRLVAG